MREQSVESKYLTVSIVEASVDSLEPVEEA